LLFEAYEADLNWPIEFIWRLIGKVFPPQLLHRLQNRHLPYGGIDWMFPGFIHPEFSSKNNWRKNPGKIQDRPSMLEKSGKKILISLQSD
jgi:hypothetical protein